jgi:hypothetical protein
MNDKIAKAGTGYVIPKASVTTSTLSSGSLMAFLNLTERTPLAPKAKKIDVESAVYAHIQAVRALGKTRIAPEEIAKALGLPLSAVESALKSLTGKGVKAIHHG